MLLKGAAAWRVAGVGDAFSHALRHVVNHLGQIVDLGVAVADEQHIGFLCGDGDSDSEQRRNNEIVFHNANVIR